MGRDDRGAFLARQRALRAAAQQMARRRALAQGSPRVRRSPMVRAREQQRYRGQAQQAAQQRVARTQSMRRQVLGSGREADPADELIAQFDAGRATGGGQPQQEEQSGLRGIFGSVIGNPIVRAALKPLEVLDTPRRVVVSGVKELNDYLSNQFDEPDEGRDAGLFRSDDVSLGDFLTQMNDPSFGFGDFVNQEYSDNPWVNRGIGFVGDVALDPLTYATFGTHKFATAPGRLALAEQARLAGLADDVVNRAARIGEHGLSRAERAAIPALPRAGMRVAGARVPGTERLAEGVGGAMARGRAGLASAFPRAAEGMRYLGPARDEAVRPFVNELLSGRGGREAASALAFRRASQGGEREFVGRAFRDAEGVAAKFGGDPEVTHAIEAGRRVAPRATGVVRKVEHDAENFMENVAQLAETYGVTVPRLSTGKPYVPHLWTKEGLEALREHAPDIHRLVINPDTTSGRLATRQITPGTTLALPNGQQVTFTTATIKDITDTLRRAVPELRDVKLMEDDFGVLASRYVADIARDVGARVGLGELSEFVEQVPNVVRPGPVDPGASAREGARVARQPLQGPGMVDPAAEAARLRPMAEGELRGVQGDLMSQLTQQVDAARQGNYQAWRDTERTGRLKDVDPARAAATHDAWRAARQELHQAKRELTAAKAELRRGGRDTAELDQWASTLQAAMDAAPSVSPALRNRLDAARGMLADVARFDDDVAAQDAFMEALRSGQLTPVFSEVLQDGWRAVSSELGGRGAEGLAIREEMQQALQRVVQATKDPSFVRVLDTYTNFFKSWATATPGFHVRNGLSATFMNSVAGVSLRNMRDGANFWHAFRDNPSGEWWRALPVEHQQAARDAVTAVYGSGAGGQFSRTELIHNARSRTTLGKAIERTYDNRLTRKSMYAGEWVEGGVRMGMALDSIRAGDAIATATARINRYHFNYSDVSGLDRVAKRIIPFWTFMSRNVPLQVQEMWLNPRRYQQYASLMRNLDADPNDERVMPLWMQEQGGVFMGEGPGVLMPDLGHTRLNEDFEKLADPGRFLNDVNPMFRVPLELQAGRQFFTGQPFEDGAVTEADPITTFLASLAGQTFEAGNGAEVMDQRAEYAARSFNPLFAQVGRLSGTGRYDDRQKAAILRYLGLPYQEVTPGYEANELRRRAYEEADRNRPPSRAREEALARYGR